MILDLPIYQAESKQIKLTWKENFKRELYKKNAQFLKKSVIKDTRRKKKVFEAQDNFLGYFNTSCYIELEEEEREGKQPYSYYSFYIPLLKSCKFEDELSLIFPYLKFLNEEYKIAETEKCYGEISSCILEGTKQNNFYYQWGRCLSKYLCGLDAIQRIEIYLELLKNGTVVLNSLYQKYAGKCDRAVFLRALMGAKNYLKEESKSMVTNLKTISISRGQQINEMTMSKTMKMLFCPVCLIYDCGIHIEDKCLHQHNYQYVSAWNVKDKKEHLNTSLQLIQHHSKVLMQGLVDEGFAIKNACSGKCYLYLSVGGYGLLQMRRAKLASPLVKGIMNIGKHMFSYNPCLIWILFNNDKQLERFNITCQLVYLYFIQEENIFKHIQRKLQNTEYMHLIHQHQLQDQKHLQIRKDKKDKKIIGTHPTLAEISICYHHFLNQDSTDINCDDCDCRKRGFCLPQCLCTENCLIKRKGCDCPKGQCNKKCECFSMSEECQPGVCKNCFAHEDCQKINKCKNNSILLNKKCLIRVGVSSIEGAGLGAFAHADIKQNELVTIYTGAIIRQEIEEIRENTTIQNSFYNFACPDGTVDSKYMGNKSRFMNHGNSPSDNVMAEIKFTNGKRVIAFYAKKDIKKDEELFFNYDGNGDIFKNHKSKYPFIKKSK